MLYAAAALAGLGMVASVNAAGHQRHAALHNRHANEKWSSAAPSAANATACGCKTYTTTWYGEPGLVPGTKTSTSTSVWTSTSTSSTSTSTSIWSETSTSTSVWVAPTTSSTSETPSSTWVPPPSTSSTPPPETYAAPSSSSWAPAPSSSSSSSEGGLLGGILPSVSMPSWSTPSVAPYTGGSSSITPNGDKWAMTYTPYDNSGQCKSASDVASDIAQIKAKGFTSVRLYATDCSGVENVGSACKSSGLKLIMGIYLDGSGLSNGYSQISELTSWGSSNGWDNVEMVVAGNEAIFNGYVSASELAGFLGDVKSQFKSAGFSGPITTTEPLGTIQENSATICGAVDVVAANIHPFFNNAIDAAGAGDFVSSQLELLSQACGGSKDAYNLETGWPSAGDANGAAIPGTSEQQTAVEAIIASAGSKSAIFSFENDGWKAPGSLGVEQFWGCSSLFPNLL